MYYFYRQNPLFEEFVRLDTSSRNGDAMTESSYLTFREKHRHVVSGKRKPKEVHRYTIAFSVRHLPVSVGMSPLFNSRQEMDGDFSTAKDILKKHRTTPYCTGTLTYDSTRHKPWLDPKDTCQNTLTVDIGHVQYAKGTSRNLKSRTNSLLNDIWHSRQVYCALASTPLEKKLQAKIAHDKRMARAYQAKVDREETSLESL